MVVFRHEGVQRLAGFFMAFVFVMGLSFFNLLRSYHRADHQYSEAGGDVPVPPDLFANANANANANLKPVEVYTAVPPDPFANLQPLTVGALEMANQLQRQIEQTAALPTAIAAAAAAAPGIKTTPPPTIATTSISTSIEGGGEEEKQEETKAEPAQEAEAKVKKPDKILNVALFYADDWTMKVLGKLDNNVKTPNIDKMADNGMLFTNNCVTTSVCWASRSTLATGAYTAIHEHTMPFSEAEFETKHWSKTLYPLMKNNDYYTGLFGKWHKLEIREEVTQGFDEAIFYYGRHWEERDGRMRHVTDLNKSDSIKFLKSWKEQRDKVGGKHAAKPFFLTTAFFATHARDGEWPSYQPTNETRNAVYPDDLIIPKAKTATNKHWGDLPDFLRHSGNEGRTRWIKRFDPHNFQTSIKDMYAMATEVDEAVGAIVEEIRKMGVYNETVLIFTTDNGNMHGEHGLAEKWYPFEESLRVPLVIQDPRMPVERRGTFNEAWTLNVDLTTTILAVAGIPPSNFMQGRDIADLYINKEEKHNGLSTTEMIEAVDWRKDWFYEFNLGVKDDASDHPWKNFIDASFALVTDEWKYVVWPQHDNYEQLFHRSVDPFDEWDLLTKVLRPKEMKEKMERAAKNGAETFPPEDENANGPFQDTVQTTVEIYNQMKERYSVLKQKAQAGERV